MSSLGNDLAGRFSALVEVVKNLLRRSREGNELLLDRLIGMRSDIGRRCEDEAAQAGAVLGQLQNVDASCNILGKQYIEAGVEGHAAGAMQDVCDAVREVFQDIGFEPTGGLHEIARYHFDITVPLAGKLGEAL